MNPEPNRNLGEIVIARQVTTPDLSPGKVRSTILLLAGSIALMMTGFGIIFPVFARRLGELGEGVQTLGLMTMAFALAQFIAAPFMGSLADRVGRKPLILVGLASFMVMNIGFLLVDTTEGFILLRALEGALTAGIFPSAMGVVADVAPENERGKWSGILMGGYGAGFIFGPVIGGLLYDRWGFAMPFILSAAFGAVALTAASMLIPETRTMQVRRRDKLLQRRSNALNKKEETSVWASLPRPLYLFGTLLFIDFVIVFTFAFVEPQMVFYLYEVLGWTTVEFGLVVGFYGGAMVVCQTFLGRLSDRFDRKPVILLGLILYATFYIGLALGKTFYQLAFVALLSGMGEALVLPAQSAMYLDITSEKHRARILGLKSSSAALGGVAGPLLVAWIGPYAGAEGVFLIALIVMLLTVLLAFLVLKEPEIKTTITKDLDWETERQRAITAEAVFQGIVINALGVRSRRASWQR